MKRWECSVCGYIHEGEEPPEKCPVCGALREKFFEITTQDVSDSDETTVAAKQTEAAPETLLEKVSDLVLNNHLHPITVHAPNGIVPVAVLFLVLGMFFCSPALADASYYNLVAVLLAMPLTLATGYITWQKKYQGEMNSLFKKKIGASCAATVILFGLVLWRIAQPDLLSTPSLDRWLFLMWSSIVLALVGLAGHLGGQLVFAKK